MVKRLRLDKNNTCRQKIVIDSLNLPAAFKRSISRAIFQHPGPQLSITITPGENQLRVFPSWKSGKRIE